MLVPLIIQESDNAADIQAYITVYIQRVRN